MFWNRTKVPQIDPKTLKEWLDNDKDVTLIDVRRPDEWKKTGVVPGSLMITNSNIRKEMNNGLNLNQDKPVVTICRSGSRSKRVAKFLINEDIDAYNLKSGIAGWYRNNYEVEKV